LFYSYKNFFILSKNPQKTNNNNTNLKFYMNKRFKQLDYDHFEEVHNNGEAGNNSEQRRGR